MIGTKLPGDRPASGPSSVETRNSEKADRAAEIAVERAIAEIRAARPVIVTGKEGAALAFPAEALDAEAAAWLGERAEGNMGLILSAPRLRYLGLDRVEPGRIALVSIDLERIAELVSAVGVRLQDAVEPLDSIEAASLGLCRLALSLPALVSMPIKARGADYENLLSVTVEQARSYRVVKRRLLRIVGRAPVPLEGAPHSEFVVFRGGEGLRDQVAIIVGAPDFAKPTTVRLHSACLTGDLFGSLKCDCGDQLRHTARLLAENGGGVLLYLDQEGRGNGLGNKIRAYCLQAQGFDTYDADQVLGFDHDHRGFAFAAEMLRQLGVARVRLMTNNPVKIAALEDAGLEVVSDHRIVGRTTEQNSGYLEAKRERGGHLIEPSAASPIGKIKG